MTTAAMPTLPIAVRQPTRILVLATAGRLVLFSAMGVVILISSQGLFDEIWGAATILFGVVVAGFSLYGALKGRCIVIEAAGLKLPAAAKKAKTVEWRWIEGFKAVKFRKGEYTGIKLSDPEPLLALYSREEATKLAEVFEKNRQRVGAEIVIERCYRDRSAEKFATYLEGFRQKYVGVGA